MAQIIAKLASGSYTNNDSVNKLLGYISTNNLKPVTTGGYGFFPPTVENAISEFNRIDNLMNTDNQQRKVWHLILAFDSTVSKQQAFYITDIFAFNFSTYGYRTFFGLHSPKGPKEGRGVHLHLAIQYYGSTYMIKPLTPSYFMNLFQSIKDYIESAYHMDIQWEEPEINV